MATYRKKGTVKAEVFDWGMEDTVEEVPLNATIGFGCKVAKLWATSNNVKRTLTGVMVPVMNTKQGPQMVKPGDFIITNPDGERYPCNASIFEETYEFVDL